MAIWFLGHSGSGKTTLVNGLQNLIHCDTLSLGELLRSNYPPQCILEGNIPESEIFSIVSKRMASVSTNLILVDNFPIKQTQLESWEKCYPLPLIVFFLEIEDSKPRKLERGRLDDTQVIHTIRKLQFQSQTLPVIGYLDQRSLVVRLDGLKPRRQLVQEAFTYIRQEFIAKQINFCDTSLLIAENQSETSKLPTKAFPFSAGFDIFLTKSIIIAAHKTEVHSISVCMEIPARSVGIIFSRSSTAIRGLLIHSGVIDPAYSNSLKLIISNLTTDLIFIDHEIAVAQILILPTYCPTILEGIIIKSGRSGFGSSNG